MLRAEKIIETPMLKAVQIIETPINFLLSKHPLKSIISPSFDPASASMLKSIIDEDSVILRDVENW